MAQPATAGKWFETASPVDDSAITRVARIDASDIDAAAQAAKVAFPAWRDTPALAAGRTVMHKPAEFGPWTARILMDIAEVAGLPPPGIWNLVNGMGEEAGRALTERPEIKAIANVGESGTGSAIMAQGAPTLKRVHFELRGRNPIIVFDDADLDTTLDATIFVIYALNGERCTSSSRLLVQGPIADAFEAKLAARAKAIEAGHPLDPATEIWPLIHAAHRAKVMASFNTTRNERATISAGGCRVGDVGQFVAPNLFTHATNDMHLAQEEIFGPVLTSIRLKSEDEALAMANDTPYWLTGYIWTSDITCSIRLSHGLKAGVIWANSANVQHLPTPFGGMKASGIGRDGGGWPFAFYMEQKHIGVGTGDASIPRLGV